MALDRPPRAAAGAISDRVRGAILAAAKQLQITPNELIALHARAEFLADVAAIVSDVEQRYQLEAGSLGRRIDTHARAWVSQDRFTSHAYDTADEGALAERVILERGRELVLFELPDAEFLAVLEHAAASVPGPITARMAEQLFTYADQALRAHGAPYRRAGKALRFEWVGDPAQHALTVGPALVALGDPRLAGARVEFEHALVHRRCGGAKELEDAIEESCKAIESTLKTLIAELQVTPPSSQQLGPLYDRLAAEGKLPGYMKDAVCASGGPRNHLSSHGQGPEIREVPRSSPTPRSPRPRPPSPSWPTTCHEPAPRSPPGTCRRRRRRRSVRRPRALPATRCASPPRRAAPTCRSIAASPPTWPS